MGRVKQFDVVNVPAFTPINFLSTFDRVRLDRTADDRFETITGHEGEYTRVGVRGKWMKWVEQEVYLEDCTLAEITETFIEVAARLGVSGPENLALDFRVERDPYDDYDCRRVYLRGQREAISDEVVTIDKYRQWEQGKAERDAERAKQYLIERAKRQGLTAADLA